MYIDSEESLILEELRRNGGHSSQLSYRFLAPPKAAVVLEQ